MSHFSVIVIGPDPEAQLEPFDENRAVEPYKERISLDEAGRAFAFVHSTADEDVEAYVARHGERHFYPRTPEALAEAAQQSREYHAAQVKLAARLRSSDPADQLAAQLEALDAYHGEGCGLDDEGYFRTTTYNPDSKWDWYQLGGRWSGYFKLKESDPDGPPPAGAALGRSGAFDNVPEPGHVDQAPKGLIDLEGMRRDAGEKAAVVWDDYYAIVKDLPEITPWSRFTARVDAKELGIERARELYHQQARIQAVREAAKTDSRWVWVEHEAFSCDRRTYVARAEAGAVPGYAVLHEGRWIAPGEMGWFGMSNETEGARWGYLEHVNGLLDSLPDDTLLSAYDLHI